MKNKSLTSEEKKRDIPKKMFSKVVLGFVHSQKYKLQIIFELKTDTRGLN